VSHGVYPRGPNANYATDVSKRVEFYAILPLRGETSATAHSNDVDAPC
jgi:hypothetical protein